MANLINMIIAGIRNRRLAAERNRAYREAIRELEAYSDYQLNDLGIARCDIARAVKYGTSEHAAPEKAEHEVVAGYTRKQQPVADFQPSGCVAVH
jgi:uncharacterized protein YjiS (DUF1127 family)